MLKKRTSTLTVCAVLTFAACGGSDAATPASPVIATANSTVAATSTEVTDEVAPTVDGTTVAPSTTSETIPATTPAATEAPIPETPAPTTVPALVLPHPDVLTALAVGDSLDGPTMGTDLIETLVAYGSGTEFVDSNDTITHLDFLYGDRTAYHFFNPDGEIIIDSDNFYVFKNNAWVRGDPNSADAAERDAYAYADLVKNASDPQLAIDLISASPSWVYAGAQENVTFPDGSTIVAERFVNSAPFTFDQLGITIDDMTLWVLPDFTPVGNAVTIFGATTTQWFTGLGEPVVIETPI